MILDRSVGCSLPLGRATCFSSCFTSCLSICLSDADRFCHRAPSAPSKTRSSNKMAVQISLTENVVSSLLGCVGGRR